MTVAELRALLECLPERFDDTEVLMYAGPGLCHIESVELDRRKLPADALRGVNGELFHPARLARKLRLSAGLYRGSRVLWYDDPPEWRLFGWWPKEASDIGLREDT